MIFLKANREGVGDSPPLSDASASVLFFTEESPAFHRWVLAAVSFRAVRNGNALRTNVVPLLSETSRARRCPCTRSAASNATCFRRTQQFSHRLRTGPWTSCICRNAAHGSAADVPTGSSVVAHLGTDVRMWHLAHAALGSFRKVLPFFTVRFTMSE